MALEIVSILVAILLALAVNHWQEDLAHHRLVTESLSNVRTEMEQNRAAVLQAMPIHRRVEAAFTRFVTQNQGAKQVPFQRMLAMFLAAAPRGFQPVHGDTVAWQIAQSTLALAYMPYAQRALLTRVYDRQEKLYLGETHFADAAFSNAAPSQDYYVQSYVARLWLVDVTNDERELLNAYDRALEALPASKPS